MNQEKVLLQKLNEDFRFPNDDWKFAQTASDNTRAQVLNFMKLSAQGVSHVLESASSRNEADEEVLRSVTEEIKSIEQAPMTVVMLGKAEVGKSFVTHCMVIQDAPDEAVQPLMESGGGKCGTTVPTMFRYAPQFSVAKHQIIPSKGSDSSSGTELQEEEVQPIDVIEFPSPLLKKFNLQLVDTPGMTSVVDKAARDLFKHQTPDAIWILPSYNNRVPDLNDIVIALEQLNDIGFFDTKDPVFIPSVTYILNPRFSEEPQNPEEQEEEMRQFQVNVKAAICYVFNLRAKIDQAEQNIEDPALYGLHPALKSLLDSNTTLMAIRNRVNGMDNAYYHIHRLEFAWFRPEVRLPSEGATTDRMRYYRPTDVKLTNGTKAAFESILQNLRNQKTIRHMISCSQKLHRVLCGYNSKASDSRSGEENVQKIALRCEQWLAYMGDMELNEAMDTSA